MHTSAWLLVSPSWDVSAWQVVTGIVLISTLLSNLGSVINFMLNMALRRQVTVAKTELEKVHTAVNSNYIAQKAEIAELRGLLDTARGTLATAEDTRVTLARETASALVASRDTTSAIIPT